MSIIEQIKAEIERLKEKYTNMMPTIQKCSVCDELLSFLDTLEEEPVNPERKLRKVSTWVSDTEFGEEVEKVRQQFPEVGFAKVSRIAHHFVEWQKNREKSGIPTNLDFVAQFYAENHSRCQEEADAFKAGAMWDREQMMKELRSYCLDEMERFQGADAGSRAAREVYYDIIGYLDNHGCR